MSLRAELIDAAGGMPAFAVLLPAGWEATDPSFSTMRPRLDAVLGQLPATNRPLVRARLEEMTARVQADASRAEVIRVFAPAAVDPTDYIPVSLVASWLRAPAGGSLQDLGGGLIAHRGATALDPAGTILHWPLREQATVEGGEVQIAGSGYLLPIPGQPAAGLMFRSQILHGVEDAVLPDAGEQALSRLCDTIVASVRWRRG
ncbi:MAG: hypothetical protein ACK5LN_01865 [Propioniciclava sp.]